MQILKLLAGLVDLELRVFQFRLRRRKRLICSGKIAHRLVLLLLVFIARVIQLVVRVFAELLKAHLAAPLFNGFDIGGHVCQQIGIFVGKTVERIGADDAHEHLGKDLFGKRLFRDDHHPVARAVTDGGGAAV